MRPEAIDAKAKRVLEAIGKSPITHSFYLGGGTALALQLGHRKSIDLDWFSESEFTASDLKKTLAVLGKFVLNSEDEGTIHGVLDEVRLSFFHYPHKLLFPTVSFENVKLADVRDIAAMKIDAVSSRGSKKDFIDIFFLLEKYTLEELIGFFEKKYRGIKYNKLHILKSLTYFNDADFEPAPVMINEADWKDVKNHIRKKANQFLEKISK